MKPNTEGKANVSWTAIVVFLVITAAAMLFFLLQGNSQKAYIIKPVIDEQVSDTTFFTINGKKVIVYRLKDGDVWIEEPDRVAYLSKKFFDKWKKEHKIK